jgi:hypothetical protein
MKNRSILADDPVAVGDGDRISNGQFVNRC